MTIVGKHWPPPIWFVNENRLTPENFTNLFLNATTRSNLWLVHGDLGVNQATIAGRVSSLTSQGGANNWNTIGATQEPTYTVEDSTLNNRGTWSLDGVAKYMVNPYDAPAPLTQPHYRMSVRKVNAWLGGRVQTELAAAIGFGLISDGTIRHIAHSANTTPGPDLDFPALQWCIVEEYFSGSTNDFTIVGPLANIASGVNLGNTNPASLGMGASRTGTLLSNTSHALSSAFLGLPSNSERATMRQLLLDYYGPQLLRTRKVCRYFPVGDSNTLDVLGDYTWRGLIADQYFYELDYPTFSVGSTSVGNSNPEFNRHGGITGQTIAGCSTYLLDPTTGQLRPGGPLVNSVQLMLLMIGTNDMPSYVPVTTATAYESLLNDIHSAIPNARIAVSTILPRNDANNVNVIAFNAELPAIWDVFDIANPTTPLIRIDAFNAVGGAWSSSNFSDALHFNPTGSALYGNAVNEATVNIFDELTTF